MKTALVAVVVALGAVQFCSDGLLHAYAASFSIPRHLPHAVGVRAFGSDVLPPFMREVDAEVAIDDGRVDEAHRIIANLPAGREREDLDGRLAAAAGDARAAVADYIAAGDLARVDETVDELARRNDLAPALATQRDIVRRLQSYGDYEALARADWRLGQLEAQGGEHAKALDDYRAALRLVPLSETYLLAAGTEALHQEKLPLARSYYARVVALDPGSLDGHIGLGRVAAAAGDVATARKEAAFVRARDEKYPSLQWLEDELAGKTH